MLHTLKLECIGDHLVAYRTLAGLMAEAAMPGAGRHFTKGMKSSMPWVAEIIGIHQRFKFERRFLRGKKDYSKSNSIGSRGVYIFYELAEGPIYEIHDRKSWASSERYFCRYGGGTVARLTEEQVISCLTASKSS